MCFLISKELIHVWLHAVEIFNWRGRFKCNPCFAIFNGSYLPNPLITFFLSTLSNWILEVTLKNWIWTSLMNQYYHKHLISQVVSSCKVMHNFIFLFRIRRRLMFIRSKHSIFLNYNMSFLDKLSVIGIIILFPFSYLCHGPYGIYHFSLIFFKYHTIYKEPSQCYFLNWNSNDSIYIYIYIYTCTFTQYAFCSTLIKIHKIL